MAKGKFFRSASRAAGKPLIPQVSVVAGAAVSTNIAVVDYEGNGIHAEDLLLTVLEFQPPTAGSGNAIVKDHVAHASVTSTGNVQLDGTDTSAAGNQLLIIWYKARP